MAAVAATVPVAWRFSVSDSVDGRGSASGSIRDSCFVHRSVGGSVSVRGSRRKRLREQNI